MGKRVITCSLSGKELDRMVDEIDRHYNILLYFKTSKLLEILADKGIETGKANCGEYGSAIAFSKKVLGNQVTIIASDRTKIKRQWRYKGDIKEVEISPLLMAEFGSGFNANDMFNLGKYGQGTFPNQKHAFDANGWYWVTPDGEKHHSYGESPTHPMYSMVLELLFEVQSVAREVFK